MGQSVFLGNFDECIGVEGVETDSGSFKGQHCLVAFQGTPAQFRTHELHDVPGTGGFRDYNHNVAGNDRTVGTLVLCINRNVNNIPKITKYIHYRIRVCQLRYLFLRLNNTNQQ